MLGPIDPFFPKVKEWMHVLGFKILIGKRYYPDEQCGDVARNQGYKDVRNTHPKKLL